VELFHKKNLPNFALIFCRSFVVAGTVFEAWDQQEVGHWRCNLNAVADKHLMAARCSFVEVGHGVGFVVGIVLGCTVLGCVLPGVDFWQVQLGAEECVDLQLQLRLRLSFEVRLVRNIQREDLVELGDELLLVGNRWHQLCRKRQSVGHQGQCSCSFQ